MILPTLARLALSTARLPAPRMMSTFGASTPFILLARAHVKPEFAKEHMEAAAVADNGVMESEPGMLHHTWDQVSRATSLPPAATLPISSCHGAAQDPDDPLGFVWSEVYANDAALLAHLENPPLLKFVEQHLEMGDGFSVEVYGTLAQETKEKFNAVGEAVGFPIKYYDTTRVGYTRL